MAESVKRAKKRLGREGNRWVNERPNGEEVSKWFTENVPIADGLDHAKYVAGVTLIPGNEKTREVIAWDDGNSPVLSDVWDLVLTPYMRIETRVKYFHDLMALDKTVGVIEPVATAEQDPKLPVGFFRVITPAGPNLGIHYIACTMKATVYERGSIEDVKLVIDKRTGEERLVRRGKIVNVYPPATKVVPLLTGSKNTPDPFALMKAETGATGRALGLAGMLVIPGTGIATAEDVQEVGNPQPEPSDAAELPDDVEPAVQAETESTDEEMRKQIAGLIDELAQFEPVQVEFKAWAKERGYARLSEVTQPALRGLLRRAQNMLADARKAAGEPNGEPTVKDEADKPAAE